MDVSEKIIVGIDLGTTNSLISYWTEDGPQIIPNVLGDSLTPSVVSVDDKGQVYVGKIARERLVSHSDQTAAAFKRAMGTKKKYKLGRMTFSPEELSSLVLKSLKADADTYFSREITDAVISVPAYFNDDQRQATMNAAKLAGLNVLRLISEPTAAALAYGLHQKEEETQFLVLDLGGGTFDISILDMFEDIMDVQSVAGDTFLGGEDFTKAISDLFLEKYPEYKETNDKTLLTTLYKQSEMCKFQLSKDESFIMKPIAGGKEIPFEVTQEQFYTAAQPLLDRMRRPIERAIRDAGILPQDLNAVILVGGATRMPMVKSMTAKMFRMLPLCNINPDEAIAMGAAVQAALIGRDSSLSEKILTDVCPFTLGTEVNRIMDAKGHRMSAFHPIIERNTTIPVSRCDSFVTIYDNQTFVVFNIYQGESRYVEDNLLLGELRVAVPPAKAGMESVDVRFTYDINGILEVEAVVNSNGQKSRTVIESRKSGMSKSEIEASLARLQSIKIHPRERTENRLLLARAERMFEESLGDRRAILMEGIYRFEFVLEKQDEKEIAKEASAFKEFLSRMDEGSIWE
jgi:molecular chaperone HscC